MRTSRLSKYSIVKLYQNAAKMRPARRRPEVVSNPSLKWTRDYEYPTSFGAESDGGRVIIRMIEGQRVSGIRPFSPVSYELSVGGRVVGTFENLRTAFRAAEQMLAPQSPQSIPDRPVDAALKEASTTMGAALLSGTSELVSKETAISESRWSKYQRDIFAFVRDGVGNAIIEAVAGSGKCLGRGTPVMLHDGRVVPVEAVRHGDLLMGSDSQPRRVLSTNTGRGPLYKIVPVKGDPWVCNDVHILTVVENDDLVDISLVEYLSHPVAWRQARPMVRMLPNARRELVPFAAVRMDDGEYFGFTLDGDGRFLLGDFTVTHNTTTIMESLNYIPRDKSVLILAFNKSIELELKQRVPEGHNVTIRTLTAYGFTFLRQYWRNEFDKETFKRRDANVVQDGIGEDFDTLIRTGEGLKVTQDVSDLVALCQSYLAESSDEIEGIQNEHQILVDKSGDRTAMSWSFDANKDVTFRHNDVLRWVKSSLRAQLKRPGDGKSISFRDMVYVSAMHPEWPSQSRYDFVFVDETQDTDIAQLSLVMRAVKPGGRIICVGDRRQSIYRFRGADSEAMPRMQKRLDAKLLPLSVSYRVTQCSALEARKIVPEFSVPEGTPPGICEEVMALQMIENWKIGDIVISRINAPMISLALIALSQGKLPLIMGEGDQIQKTLNKVIDSVGKKMTFRDRSVEAMEPLIDKWADEERQRAINKVVQSKIDRKWNEYMVTDPVTLEVRSNFLTGVEDEISYKFAGIAAEALKDIIRRPDINSIADLKIFIKKIAPDDDDLEGMNRQDPEKFKRMRQRRIVFTSVHRIKGSEGRRIFVLEDTFGWGRKGKKGKRAKTAKEEIEEQNLWYVAVTRVMHQRADEKKKTPARDGELYFVTRLDEMVGRLPGQETKKPKYRDGNEAEAEAEAQAEAEADDKGEL